MDNSVDRIISLDQSNDFQVVEGEPDVRGWGVFGADGRRIGEVHDLLVDTGAMKVRYLDVEADPALFTDESDHHILIPIGYARLDEVDDRIQVDALDSGRVPDLPEYSHGRLTEDFAAEVDVFFSSGRRIGSIRAEEELSAPVLGSRADLDRENESRAFGDLSDSSDPYASDSTGDLVSSEEEMLDRSIETRQGRVDEVSIREEQAYLGDRSMDEGFDRGAIDDDREIRRRLDEEGNW
jgi:sporulation protein YlmC with PRC-barrel domain